MASIKFLTLILFYLYNFIPIKTSASSPKFASLFVIGDSVMDTGNNDYIHTWVKSNYAPYGQNYTTRFPTGRFSNGQLLSDMFASYLGLKDSLPPYLNPSLTPEDLITGVNFASAGSGFDDYTSITSKAVPVSKQMENFKQCLERLKSVFGEERVNSVVSNSLIVLSAGTNDWLFNYYDVPLRRLTYDVKGYQDFLLGNVQNFIQELYGLGCRKVLVSGLAPTGCLPVQMTLSMEKHCKEEQSRDSLVYNQKLVRMLSKLEQILPGIRLVYNDFYTPVVDMISHPNKYGFVETRRGCCIKRGSELLSPFCSPKVAPCQNPDQYLFWDAIHPTLAAYTHVFKHISANVLPQLA